MEQHKCVPVCLLGAQNVLEVWRDYYFCIKEKATIVLRISNACLKVYGMAFEIFLLMRQNDTEINCCLLDCFSPKTRDIIQKVSHRVEMENGHTSQLAKGLNLFLT